MSELNSTISSEQEVEDKKRLNRLKIIFPLYNFTTAGYFNLEGYYLTFFLTNVYLFSVNQTAGLALISSVLAWAFAPIFATFVDRFKFKQSKYWPWLVMGFTGVLGSLMLIMSIPALAGGKNLSSLVPLVFVLIVVVRLSEQLMNVPMQGMFPKMAKSPGNRQYFAVSRKVGSELGKALFGYILPLALVAFTAASSGNEYKGYMIAAIIFFGLPLITGWILALFGVKGSYVEREGIADVERAKAKKIPLSAALKTLFTNRPVLGLFLFFTLHKTAFFIYVAYGTYIFTYILDINLLGAFFTLFSIGAVAGALAGRIWTKIFKESKRSCVMAMGAHVAVTAIIAIFFKGLSTPVFLGLFAVSTFFMGMLENWVQPLFAASADYGSWKTGARADSLIMTVFGLSVNVSWAMTPVLAAIVLNAVNYTEFVASGAAINDTVASGLTFLFAWLPLILAGISLASLIFIFNLNDNKIKAIQEDLAAGKTKETSSLEIS